MTVEQFEKMAKYEELVNLDNEWSVYKLIYGFNAESVKFYYFYKNKLIKMDEGQRATDYRVRIDTHSY